MENMVKHLLLFVVVGAYFQTKGVESASNLAYLVCGTPQTPTYNETTFRQLTIPMCRYHCLLSGHTRALMHNGDTCLCSGDGAVIAGGTCTVNCSGDIGQICGGDDGSDVYSIYTSYEPTGCYKRGLVDVSTANVSITYRRMSQTLCKEYCRGLGATYVTVRLDDCHCFNETLSFETYEAGVCNVDCDGISSQVCGGGDAYNLFYLGDSVPYFGACDELYEEGIAYSGQYTLFQSDVVTCNFNAYDEYAGCFTLPSDPGVQQGSASNPSNCKTVCRGLDKSVAMLANGGDCYCADSIPGIDPVSARDSCNMSCTGDNRTYCGGSGYSTYYSIGGCFTVQSNITESFRENFRVDTDMECTESCRGINYTYAILFARECYCENDITTNASILSVLGAEVDSSFCKDDFHASVTNVDAVKLSFQTCDDLFEIGLDRGDYFVNGTLVHCVKAEFAFHYGCKKVQNLDNKTQCVDIKPDSMTITDCRLCCATSGFEFAAAMNGTLCYCVSEVEELTTNHRRCDIPCYGDTNHYCGGAEKASVYYSVGGCYKRAAVNPSDVTDFLYYNDDMTVIMCSEICRGMDYKHAVVSGTECSCTMFKTLTNDWEFVANQCVACPGGGTDTCGNANSTQFVYVLALRPEPYVKCVDLYLNNIKLPGTYISNAYGKMYCSFEACQSLADLTNATLSTDVDLVGSVVDLSCTENTDFGDESTQMNVVCGSDQIWYPTPKLCSVMYRCQNLSHFTNAVAWVENRTVGNEAYLVCPDDKHFDSGENFMTTMCSFSSNMTAMWTPVPGYCQYTFYCPSLSSLTNATVNSNITARASKVTITCPTGQMFEDHSAVMDVACGSDLNWYPSPEPCKPIPECPSLSSGTVASWNTSETKATTAAQVTCPVGHEFYDGTSSKTTMCQWSSRWWPYPYCIGGCYKRATVNPSDVNDNDNMTVIMCSKFCRGMDFKPEVDCLCTTFQNLTNDWEFVAHQYVPSPGVE